MARSARGLLGLAKTALTESEALVCQKTRLMSSESKQLAATTDGKYSPRLFGKEKPLDRSYNWMPKNPYIEAWYYRRDHYEKEFVWNFRNTVEMFWLMGGYTAGFYFLSDFALRQSDARSGYPRRSVLGDEPGFVLPDEREFY